MIRFDINGIMGVGVDFVKENNDFSTRLVFKGFCGTTTEPQKIFTKLRTEVFLPKTSLLLNALRQKDLHEEGLDRYLDTWIHSRIGK